MQNSGRFLAVLLALCLSAPVWAAEAVPPVSPAQARQAIEVLEDPVKAAEVAKVLSTVVEGGADAEPVAEAEAEPVAPAPVVPAPAPAPEKSPLVANGLLDQVFSQVENWLQRVSKQAAASGSALVQLRFAGQWWNSTLGSPELRGEALRSLGVLLTILMAALAAEWTLRWLVRKPRALVTAAGAAQQAREQAAMRAADAPPPVVVAAPVLDVSPIVPRGADPDMNDPVAMAIEAHGVDELPASALSTSAQEPTGRAARRDAVRQWALLQRMPYALANALLDLFPLVGFMAVSGLLMALPSVPSSGFHPILLPILNAYVTTRVCMAVARLMVTPRGQGLRLAHVTDVTARYLFVWVRRLVVWSVFGTALGEVVVQMGAEPGLRIVIVKLVALVVHIMLIVMVLQSREAISERIRTWRFLSDSPSRAAVRAFLAEVWVYAAVGFILAMWVVWVLSVENGFHRALSVFASTVGVLAVSHIVTIVVLGALDRNTGQAIEEGRPVVLSGGGRYQLLVRRLVLGFIVACTGLVLLWLWGVDVRGWFEPGTMGRRVMSAASTIAVAGLLALLAWEAVNGAIERRVSRWTASGDIARAARLNTLGPMLRTCVFIVIALTVLMTTLNELGVNVGPLLAGASIIGVALGFGSQKLVQDFITGIFLLMENAMQVGDTVTVAGVTGTVEYLSIRTVRLRAGDGSLHVVPFSSVTTVNNANRGLGSAAVKLSVAADSDIEATFTALRDIAQKMREDPALSPLILGDLDIGGVDQIDGAMATIVGSIRTTDRGRWRVQREFNRRVLSQFREQGIALANPRETVVFNRESAAG